MTLTPDQLAAHERLAHAKSIPPAARQAIRDLTNEVKNIHATACAQAQTIARLTAERNEQGTAMGELLDTITALEAERDAHTTPLAEGIPTS